MKSTEYRSLGHCKYCNEEVFGYHPNKFQTHQRFCLCNPDRQKAIDARTRGSQTMSRKVSEKNHQLHLLNEKTKQKRKLKCIKCGSDYFLELTDREYQKILNDPNQHPFRKHCSQSCCNSHVVSIEQKKKISKSLKARSANITNMEKQKDVKVKILKEYICKTCGKHYHSNEGISLSFCSDECKTNHRISDETREKLREAGKRAAARNQSIRRSKNEIAFYELCEQHFMCVENNKPIFNGWDADVLIYDLKIAVLWNGIWHYKQVMKKQKSSLKMIQNRDKIKLAEIVKAGWIPYVIKDLGKHKKSFVQEKFDEFLKFVDLFKSSS